MVRIACQVFVFLLTALVSTAGKPSVAGDQPRYEVAYATYLGGSQWDQAREVISFPDGSLCGP